MKKGQNILVVDDEVMVTEFLQAYLEKGGYNVFIAHTGKVALEIYRSNTIALVILDLMLPDITGEEVCRIIRSTARTPIIMLTAKVQESEILEGLQVGADDYLLKPFSPRIVVAKVGAVLRRFECDELASLPVSYNNGRLTIDFQSCLVKKDGEPVSLTPTQYKLLSTMAKAPNRIFTRDQLICYALEDEFDGFDRSIDTYIKGLRAKIETDRKNPEYIVTVYGIGYRFQGIE
ncbi:response regulator transcription factor [Hydrogenoanaerobacterium sp.]|uniref:response regulator transcription factor n=1 Tax=Hydrogenoanaerobacterium sp. TaxID=2953763 RepID=UPI002896A2FF|nr:response regulator transcription factor [Hydrogenoanaerobacterium sp.]